MPRFSNRFGRGESRRSQSTIAIVGQFSNRFRRQFFGKLPDIPTEIELFQLMNQLFTQLTTKPLTEIHHTPFAAENILDWLDSFNWTATHNVWNDHKQLQVIPVYLKDTALKFYCYFPEQTKSDTDLWRNALRDRYHAFTICVSSCTN